MKVAGRKSRRRLQGKPPCKKPAKKAALAKAKKAAAKSPHLRSPHPKTALKQPAAKRPRPAATAGRSPGTSSCSAHHLLDGFGGMGEGMSIQIAPDGRRIIWLAHESAPKNFTAVDVSDPRKPKVVVQTDLPQAHMRSNSLETCGNIMAVAYQTQKKGQQPAGMELFDISVPEKPQVDLVLRLLGRDLARRAPALVLRRRIRPHARPARADFTPTHPQRRPVLSLHRRAQSVEAGRGRPLVDARHARRATT